jgi:hypothetical protein
MPVAQKAQTIPLTVVVIVSAKDKRGQLFICVHNETLSVVAMRVSNKECSPLRNPRFGLAAMEFRPKVDYENIKLRFT